MKRYNIHLNLLTAIKDNFLDVPLSVDEQENFDLAEASTSIPEMCNCLINAAGFRQNFLFLVESVRDVIDWNNDGIKYASVSSLGLKWGIDVVFRKTSTQRDYALYEHDLICFNSSKFTESIYDEKLLSAIEKICLANSRMHNVLEMINRRTDNSFCVIYAPNTLVPGARSLDCHRLYSYAMLRYLNNHQAIDVPPLLKGRIPISFNPTLSFVGTVHYEQYLDIYDVMNEWQLATDYLASFMKMYQVMEFMAYRCLLSDLVESNDIKHSFLRSVKNLDNKYNKNERDTFVRQLSPIFNDFSVCAPLVNNSIEDFVENHFAHDSDKSKRYLKSADGADAPNFSKAILKFVYDVRCSIVHNKDSELHFTFNNVNEYKDLIPLMQKIEEVVGSKLIDTISNPNSPIGYSVEHLDLY